MGCSLHTRCRYVAANLTPAAGSDVELIFSFRTYEIL